MNSKKTIRVDFVDFWEYFNKTDNFLYNLLSENFNVEIHDKPELLICADQGFHHKLYSCKKMFITGESHYPDHKKYDYHLTCSHDESTRNLRVPYYVIIGSNPNDLIKGEDDLSYNSHKREKFCCFVSSNKNPKDRTRIRLLEKLSTYKQVDSGGTAFNNIGGPIPNGYDVKQKFLSEYKFNLCPENETRAGYTTEKIYHAMEARCIPIYGGNHDVHKDFNPKSFLHTKDFSSEDALVDKIIELDKDDEKYNQIAKEPYFNDNKVPHWFDKERVINFVSNAIESNEPILSQKDSWLKFCRWTIAKRDKAPKS